MNITSILRASKRVLSGGKASIIDVRDHYLGQILPRQPRTLNLLINDVCNSRCQMCNVWQQKRDKELTPDELAIILRDPLFNRLRYVGVSGGEPTLRADLPEIYRVLVEKRPHIHGTGIITNAIQKDMVLERVLAAAEVCRQANLPFSVMVSLDGVGEVHDQVRGRAGNFESAVAVIRHLRDQTDIPVRIGCTVAKDNVWYVDEMLDWCRRENVYGRFRVAEFIDRLYNAGQTDYIRNFTEQEKYHLGLFFAKLEHEYEPSLKVRRIYGNIRRMLMENAPRSISCLYQTVAVMLDCRGQLAYCAPHSPALGNCLETPAQEIYRGHLEIRRAILARDCPHCIHDYQAASAAAEQWRELADLFWRRRLSLPAALSAAKRVRPAQSGGARGRRTEVRTTNYLIMGWYGTETAGDKAMLGEIIHRIEQQRPDARITLASIYPYLSVQTLKELGYTDTPIIATYSADFWRAVQAADEIVMGGGPLMHISSLGFVLRAFVRAKRAGRRTRIAGCGIGPLSRGVKYEEAVAHILRLADVIELRDTASVEWAKRLTGRADITCSGDYAMGFVRRWMARHSGEGVSKSPTLNLYLRDWPAEYQGALTDAEFRETKQRFEQQLGQWIGVLCEQFHLRPRLLPMHHFCVGGDDRDFNRRFAKTYLAHLNPLVEYRPLSVQEILTLMQEATLCLCMRFHSVLFAHTLGTPFFAIDYTQGGKVAAYLTNHGESDRMVTVAGMVNGAWQEFK
jgi:MoaA/NifB/PqqE/SkfB family radical SAM enzyme/polysaccharide pyruvyl transferase WcaK-like protein